MNILINAKNGVTSKKIITKKGYEKIHYLRQKKKSELIYSGNLQNLLENDDLWLHDVKDTV